MGVFEMKENETRVEDINSEKARIRARYKGLDPSELELIPAISQEKFYEDKREKLEKIEQTIDDIRSKYGRGIVSLGANINSKIMDDDK